MIPPSSLVMRDAMFGFIEVHNSFIPSCVCFLENIQTYIGWENINTYIPHKYILLIITYLLFHIGFFYHVLHHCFVVLLHSPHFPFLRLFFHPLKFIIFSYSLSSSSSFLLLHLLTYYIIVLAWSTNCIGMYM